MKTRCLNAPELYSKQNSKGLVKTSPYINPTLARNGDTGHVTEKFAYKFKLDH